MQLESNLAVGARAVKQFHFSKQSQANVYDLVKKQSVMMTRQAVHEITERLTAKDTRSRVFFVDEEGPHRPYVYFNRHKSHQSNLYFSEPTPAVAEELPESLETLRVQVLKQASNWEKQQRASQ